MIIRAECGLWSKTYDFPELGGDATLNMYNASGTATYYPQRSGGLFVKGGAGVAFIDMSVKVAGSSLSADLGKRLGLIAGGGYDIPVGRIAITPAVNVWYGQLGDLKILGETFATHWKQNVVDFTIGISFPR